MQIEIQNYRRIKQATLGSAPIILVAGRNGAGKSSLIQAVQACMLRDSAAPTGILKKDGALLVHDGAGKGAARVSADTGAASVAWPSGSVKEEGEAPPFASAIACGLESPLDLKPTDRMKRLADLFPARPTREDFVAAMEEAGASEAKVQDYWWGVIQEQGWDGALATVQEMRAKLKGKWEAATGQKYGPKAAEDWRPTNWSKEWDEERLIVAVTKAEAARDAALRSQGADEGRRAELQAIVDAVSDIDIEALKGVHETAVAAWKKVSDKIAALPHMPGLAHTLLDCPHCGAQSELMVQADKSFRLAKPSVEAPDPDIVKQRHGLIAERNVLAEKMGEAERAYGAAKIKMGEAKVAGEKLAVLGETKPGDPEAVQKAKDDVTQAQRDLAAFQAMKDATDAHWRIGRLETLAVILGPSGVRRVAAERAMQGFNARLAELAGAAKWPVLALGEGGEPTVDGRVYALVAESWQWRVRALFQIAMAEMDGSSVVVLDRADVLDQPGRNGLFLAMMKASGNGLRFLVAMTINKPDLVPDLQAKGVGEAYWLADGMAVPLGEMLDQKAA